MADASPLSLGGSREGEAFTGTFATDNALWLKVFGGEVLTAFEKAIEISPRVMQRTISAGRSAQFPVHGRVTSRMHKPGEDILDATNTGAAYQDAAQTGSNIGQPQDWTNNASAKYLSTPGSTEKVIKINDLMLASVFIDDLDEAKAHYDLRSAYTTELGRAMARRIDVMTSRALAAGAEGSADEVLRAGQTITDANLLTQADTMASSIIGAAQKLDEYDVPAEDRFAILSPAGYYLLLRAAGGVGGDNYAALLSKDYSLGNGDYAEGRVLMVAGVPVVVSNNTGFGVNFATAAETGEQNGLNINMTNYAGIVAHKNAAGILKLRDLQLESEYLTTHQGHLFVSKMAAGIAPLRTDAVVALKTA